MNRMYLTEANFSIPQNQEARLAEALKTLCHKQLRTIGSRSGEITDMLHGRKILYLLVDELLQCWGWSFIRDIAGKTDAITGIDLNEDFSSDEELLFETIAPFVTSGSTITVEGESSGGSWSTRYVFTRGKVIQQEPDFPPLPAESEEPFPSSPFARKGEDDQARYDRLIKEGTPKQCLIEAGWYIDCYVNDEEGELASLSSARDLITHVAALFHDPAV